MTPFAIFAFVLTFGYFIYFAVMITLDLHAKPADGQKNEEEDIDVEGMKDEGVEAPKVISESSDLESGRVTYTDTTTDDGLRVISPTGTIVQSPEEEEPVVDPRHGRHRAGGTALYVCRRILCHAQRESQEYKKHQKGECP